MPQTIPQLMPTTPRPTVSQPITFDRSQLQVTPEEISRDRSYNTWTGAAIGGVIATVIGYGLTRRGPDTLRSTLLTTAAGTIIGAGLGNTLKTGAEQRSEALLNIANKGGDFGKHLKEEMRRREHSSYWNGVITGACLFF